MCAVVPQLTGGDRAALLGNFAELFSQVSTRQQRAMREHTDDRLHETTKRLVERFKMDHRTRATKGAVSVLLEQIEQQLVDVSDPAEAVRQSMRRIRELFALSDNPLEEIADLHALRTELGRLVYGAMQREIDEA